MFSAQSRVPCISQYQLAILIVKSDRILSYQIGMTGGGQWWCVPSLDWHGWERDGDDEALRYWISGICCLAHEASGKCECGCRMGYGKVSVISTVFSVLKTLKDAIRFLVHLRLVWYVWVHKLLANYLCLCLRTSWCARTRNRAGEIGRNVGQLIIMTVTREYLYVGKKERRNIAYLIYPKFIWYSWNGDLTGDIACCRVIFYDWTQALTGIESMIDRASFFEIRSEHEAVIGRVEFVEHRGRFYDSNCSHACVSSIDLL